MEGMEGRDGLDGLIWGLEGWLGLGSGWETRRSSMEQTRLQAPRGTWRWSPPLKLGEVGKVS